MLIEKNFECPISFSIISERAKKNFNPIIAKMLRIDHCFTYLSLVYVFLLHISVIGFET